MQNAKMYLVLCVVIILSLVQINTDSTNDEALYCNNSICTEVCVRSPILQPTKETRK